MAFTEIVSSGMTVENEVISGSGIQTVESGGVTKNLTIEDGSGYNLVIAAGGIAAGVEASANGTWDGLINNKGGLLSNATVSNAGIVIGSQYSQFENISFDGDGVWAQTYGYIELSDATLDNGSKWEFLGAGNSVDGITLEGGSSIYFFDSTTNTKVSDVTVNDGKIYIYAGSTGSFVDLKLMDTTFVCSSSDVEFENIEIGGASWAQVAGDNSIDGLTIKGTTQFEVIGGEVSNVVIDGEGADYAVGDTDKGAQLLVFGSKDSCAENVTIQNGGSAHVYNDYVSGVDAPYIENVTVKDGGVLYLTNWALSSDVAGEAWDVVVESGGVVYMGGDYSILDTATFEAGSKLLGLKLTQGMYDVDVWDSYTNSYVTYDWKVGTTSIKELIIVDGVEFCGGGRTAITIDSLIVRDGGSVLEMYYASEVSGSIYGQDYSFSNGIVTGWVVVDGGTLYGDIQKYTVSSPSLQLVDVVVYEGGSLDGFRTGRVGDDSLVSTGTYVYDDGTVVEWSFGQGYAKNLVINDGCFVTQGDSGSLGAGTTEGLVINNGIFVVAGYNYDVTISGNTALQVYSGAYALEGVNTNFYEDEQYYNFTAGGGVAENLVIVNGGFYYGYTGSSISDSIFSGSRDIASGNADYAESRLALYAGSTADNITMLEGSRLDVTSATLTNSTVTGATVVLTDATISNVDFKDVNITISGSTSFENSTLNGGSTIFTGNLGSSYAGLTLVNVDVKLGTSTSNTFGGGEFVVTDEDGNVIASCIDGVLTGTFTGDGVWSGSTTGGFFINGDVAIKDVYLSDMPYDSIKLYGSSVDGVTIDCDSSWGGGLYGNTTFYNITVLGGWMSCNQDVVGLVINTTSSTNYFTTSTAACVTHTDVEIYNGILGVGNAKNDWGNAGLCYANDVQLLGTGAQISVVYGVVTNIYSEAGTIALVYGGVDCDTWSFVGNMDLSNTTITVVSNYNIKAETEATAGKISFDLSDVTSLKLNNMSLQTSLVSGEHLNAYISGVNAFTGYGADNYTMSVGNVVFDLVGDWFVDGAVWADYSAITTNSYAVNLRTGQGSYDLGAIGSVLSSITTNFGDQEITLTVGETVEVDGYEIAFSADGAITVSAIASTNTALDWTTSWNASMAYAVKYVNDIAGDSTVITLGNAMENEGGNAVANAFGTISTGAIVTDDVTNSTVFGGSDSQDIATSWVKVTGGTDNVIYGGGNGFDMTDGTNVDIYDGTTTAIFGAGKDSTTYVGENNAYAVNMDVKGGTHVQVNGGADNGFVVGDIAMYIVDIDVTSLFTGGGLNSSVDGNISIDLNGYSTSAVWTGNFYGGSAASGVDTTVTGDIYVDIDGGNYSGMLFGGSYIDGGATATVAGTITIDVNGITQSDNEVFGSVSSSWVIGGGSATDATLTTSDVVVNVTGSSVGRIVGGSVASGSAVATVADVDITVTSSTVTGSIYAAGYTIGEATAVVDGDIEVTISCTDTSLMGDIYLGGNNVGGLGSISVTGDAAVIFTGSGDSFTFTGTVSGLGYGNTDIAGTTYAVFDSYTGEFAGQIDSIDSLVFSGNTSMTFTEEYETSSITFDVTDRTSTDVMVGSDTIDLAADAEINIVLDSSSSFEFDLMDVSDEDLTGVVANLFDVDGTSLGSLDVTSGTVLIDLNRVSFEIEDGVLSIKSEGVIA